MQLTEQLLYGPDATSINQTICGTNYKYLSNRVVRGDPLLTNTILLLASSSSFVLISGLSLLPMPSGPRVGLANQVYHITSLTN